jgi:hypothetical protein
MKNVVRDFRMQALIYNNIYKKHISNRHLHSRETRIMRDIDEYILIEFHDTDNISDHSLFIYIYLLMELLTALRDWEKKYGLE